MSSTIKCLTCVSCGNETKYKTDNKSNKNVFVFRCLNVSCLRMLFGRNHQEALNRWSNPKLKTERNISPFEVVKKIQIEQTQELINNF